MSDEQNPKDGGAPVPPPPPEERKPDSGKKDAPSPKKDPEKDPPKKEDASGDAPSPGRRGGSIFLMLLALAALVYFFFFHGNALPKSEEITYHPTFINLVDAGLVGNVTIVRSRECSFVEGSAELPASGLPEGVELPEEVRTRLAAGPFRFRVNVGDADGLGNFLAGKGIGVQFEKENTTLSLFLMNILPTLLLIGVIYYVFVRQMRAANGAMSFGRSRARKLDVDEKVKVLFKDVAGCEEAKEEVVEVVEFLKDPKKFGRLGGKMPHGILMCGPPGTGKTLLAKAIAGEAGVPFFSISGSDFVEMFVGVGASRVRDMFDEAKRSLPCLVFIDEIDAVGRRRGAGIGGGHDEREQTLNALLVEMDGFSANEGIVVIAATNRPDVLDPALLRPGRFDRQLVVDLPDLEGRKAILQVHAKKVTLAEGTDLSKIARGTPGCSGADLANIVNEAALIAARLDKPAVDEDDFEAARDKVLWGKERRSHALDEEEKKLTAYHEAGHALAALLEPKADPVHKVTIIPRGRALGLTAFLPKKDRNSYTRGHILADLVVSMGGRVAEELFLEDISTGARQDLKHATELAHSYVCDWGLSEALGTRTFGQNEETIFLGRELTRTQDYSQKTAERIDEEVSRLLSEAHDKARRHLEEHRDAMEALVKALLAHETISGEDAESILKTGELPVPKDVPAEPPSPPEATPPEAVSAAAEPPAVEPPPAPSAD